MLLASWLNEAQKREWQQRHQLDFALSLPGCPRLRASAFTHSQGISLVLRLLPMTCPTLAALHTPVALAELLREESGLILVTGATGSGKSTTLAAMVDHLNHQLAGHIMTLEDPVEFVHESDSCLIHQREVGAHTASFSVALRAAQAIERLVDVFPAQEKEPVRHQLASSLCAVLSQKLQPDNHGGRVALFEMLINTPAVGNLIREGKTHQLAGVMQTGLQSGMQTFSQSYQQRVNAGML